MNFIFCIFNYDLKKSCAQKEWNKQKLEHITFRKLKPERKS